MNRPKVTVVGSLNVDYIATVERLPGAGETVAASGLLRRFGGKGANQAVAAARQGARVEMIGCVGQDDDGLAYRRRLRGEGVGVGGVSTTKSAPTGTALIAVDHAAENMIVVAAGANGKLNPGAVRAQRHRVASAQVLLLQMETPLAAVIEAVRLANRADVPIVFNPSPLREGFPWERCRLDTLIVNAGEAETLFELRVESIQDNLSAWRSALGRRRITRVIITRGAKPTIRVSAIDCQEIPTLAVKPVDTVGAGDAFAGTYAARWAEGEEVMRAIRHANCAGALATLKPGAQEALPSRTATERALRRWKA